MIFRNISDFFLLSRTYNSVVAYFNFISQLHLKQSVYYYKKSEI